MTHEKYFAKDRIVGDLQATDLEEALKELIGVFVKSKTIGDDVAARVEAAVLAKVESGVTGAIGRGVAVPHVKVDGVTETAAVFARSANELDFRAGDGVPVSVIFFVIGPPDAAAGHLDLLRWIASLGRNPDFAHFASVCKTESDLFDLLEELDDSSSS